MWILVCVNEPQDVGKNEKARYRVNDSVVQEIKNRELVSRVHPATPEQ
jgi:hypothetical protein